MITRILLGLDATPSSTAATQAALDLAEAHGAALTARVAIDAPWITRPMAVGIGGMAHKVAAETAELRRAHREAGQALDRLRAVADARGIACDATVEEGEPVALLCDLAVTADLIVLGHNAAFWGDEASDLAPAVNGMLVRNIRPVLVVPAQSPPGTRVLVAFDGSLAAARALHMAALLGIAHRRSLAVLSIAENEPTARRHADMAATLLRAHGGTVDEVVALASSTAPAELITVHQRALHAGMTVMGAYGHTGLRERLFGSCTRTMLRTCPAALLIHH